MDIEIIRKEISEKLKTAYDHIEIYNVNEPYKNILESYINSNPKNVSAYCLLAIVIESMINCSEERMYTLEKCYEENKDTFSDDEYSMWATCSAYFIFDDYGYTENKNNYKAFKNLEEAANRKSNFHQTYCILGEYYFVNELFDKASETFHTAYSISKNKKYLYCEASCLLKASKHKEGIKILESLYRYPFLEEQKEIDFSVALALGSTLLLTNEIERASVIAKILLNTDASEFSCIYDDSLLTDFLYTLGDFQYVINFYNDNEYSEDSSWRSQYFYSLKMLGQKKEATLKLESLIKEYDELICDYEVDDEFETELEKEETIAELKETIEGIKKCYTDVFEQNIKPTTEPYYDITYECYYIGCPHHDTN